MVRAGLAALFALATAAATATAATADIASARYTAPTTRYDHGVLGDTVEWGALALTLTDGRRLRLLLPQTRVFEDLAPRLADLDSDGDFEVIVVETDLARGASLAVYDETGRLAATPFLGQPHRWRAPLGAADIDGDGSVEIAEVTTPHLGKTLRLWQLDGARLTEVATLPGVTVHQIGWDWIAGGLRRCGPRPELIAASADWADLLAIAWDGTRFTPRRLGPWSKQANDSALACR